MSSSRKRKANDIWNEMVLQDDKNVKSKMEAAVTVINIVRVKNSLKSNTKHNKKLKKVDVVISITLHNILDRCLNQFMDRTLFHQWNNPYQIIPVT